MDEISERHAAPFRERAERRVSPHRQPHAEELIASAAVPRGLAGLAFRFLPCRERRGQPPDDPPHFVALHLPPRRREMTGEPLVGIAAEALEGIGQTSACHGGNIAVFGKKGKGSVPSAGRRATAARRR